MTKKIFTDFGPPLVTTNPEEFLSAINNFNVSGAHGCDENILSGIDLALKHALPRSYVYILTDALSNDFLIKDVVIEQIEKTQPTVKAELCNK